MGNRISPKPFLRKVIASPEDYNPLSDKCQVLGSFNPGAVMVKNDEGDLETLLMVRVAESPKTNLTSNYSDRVFLPYFNIHNKVNQQLEMKFDEVLDKDILSEGKKEVRIKNGTFRLKHISLPRFLHLDDKGDVLSREQNPALYPAFEYERFGMEDFRITPFEDGRFILTYVSPHRDFGVSTPFLITNDFKEYKHFPEDNTPRPIMTGIKDVIIFPEKIPSPSKTEIIQKGQKMYAGFIRPNAFYDVSKPGVWVSYSPDLVHWGQDHRLTISKNGETTGSGTPAIKLGKSWISAYHETNHNNKGEGVYKTKLMRMNHNEPWKNFKSSGVLLDRKDYLDLLPRSGYVPNVVFTSGITNKDGIVTLYSGIDDTWTVMDKFYEEDLVKFLNKS